VPEPAPRSLPPNSRIWWAVLALAWFSAINQLRIEWTTNPQYNFGWSVPFLCLYLCLERLRRPTPSAPVGTSRRDVPARVQRAESPPSPSLPSDGGEGRGKEAPISQLPTPISAPHPYSLILNPYSSPSDGAPFTIMYSGNFGLAHAFEPIVEAVRLLATRDATIRFHFVGDGPRLPWLQEQLSGCPNAQFLPFQPPENLQSSLASADLHLASMRKDLCGLVVPSKVYGILAAGRPCLFIGPQESEVARLIASNSCGEVLEEASGEILAAKILKWKNSPEDLQKAAKKAEELSGTLTVGKAANAPAWG
jgi:glycosyltransferase involved in cell wall biosynthesis